jgi:hypothetical protein
MKTRRLCESKGTFIFHATAETRAKIVERCAIWTRPTLGVVVVVAAPASFFSRSSDGFSSPNAK